MPPNSESNRSEEEFNGFDPDIIDQPLVQENASDYEIKDINEGVQASFEALWPEKLHYKSKPVQKFLGNVVMAGISGPEYRRFDHPLVAKRYFQRLERIAVENKDAFDDVLNFTKERTAAKFVVSGVKDEDRAVEKLRLYDSPEELVDVLRGRLVYDRLDDLYEGVEVLRKHPGVQGVRIVDRVGSKHGESPHIAAYRNVQMQIVLNSGCVCEVQLDLEHMLMANEKGIFVPRNKLPLEDDGRVMNFNDEEKELAFKVHQDLGYQGELRLDSEGVIAGHYLYELRRHIHAMPDYLQNKLNYDILRTKLQRLEKSLNEYAWSLYMDDVEGDLS